MVPGICLLEALPIVSSWVIPGMLRSRPEVAQQPLFPTCRQWDAEVKCFAQRHTADDWPNENVHKLQGKRSSSDHCVTHSLIWRWSRTIHTLHILVSEQTPLSCSFQLPRPIPSSSKPWGVSNCSLEAELSHLCPLALHLL